VFLPRGVSASVKEAAKKIAESGGREALAAVAKMHFKTAAEVLANS
jgi:ribonuclease HIII